jgi:hypothetical protein
MNLDSVLDMTESILKKMDKLDPKAQEFLDELKHKDDKEKTDLINNAIKNFSSTQNNMFPKDFDINTLLSPEIKDDNIEDILNMYKNLENTDIIKECLETEEYKNLVKTAFENQKLDEELREELADELEDEPNDLDTELSEELKDLDLD